MRQEVYSVAVQYGEGAGGGTGVNTTHFVYNFSLSDFLAFGFCLPFSFCHSHFVALALLLFVFCTFADVCYLFIYVAVYLFISLFAVVSIYLLNCLDIHLKLKESKRQESSVTHVDCFAYKSLFTSRAKVCNTFRRQIRSAARKYAMFLYSSSAAIFVSAQLVANTPRCLVVERAVAVGVI